MQYQPRRRREDQGPRRFAGFFHRIFFVIGVAATISVFFLFLTLSRMMNYTPPALPEKILLTYTFKAGVSETAGKPSLSQPLLRPAATLQEIVEALRAAAKDDRVKGFAARLEDADFSLAQVQELRDALAAFRKAGKFAWIYSDSFGGFSSGMGDYYLASAFENVWMQPVGVVAVNGMAMEVPFVKGVLDKVGVTADFAHKGAYKATPESLTETGMSPEHRAMVEGLLSDLSAQVVSGMSADRGLTEADMRATIDMAPLSDTAALQRRLIDRIGYHDEMIEEAKAKAGLEKDADSTDLLGYALVSGAHDIGKGMPGFVSKLVRKDAPPSAHKDKAKIALIYGVGDIVPYGGKSQAGIGESGMSADKIVAAFRSAQKDEDVAAIVFRVDSPGGAPSAAETIRRAIVQARAKGKPVVVSMGGSAASGGYWVATGADRIVAQPATLTGSIGVFGGKFVLAGLWDKLDVKWEGAAVGKSARMWSSNAPFTPEEKARFDAMLGNIYDAFIARVMEGRNMSRERALSVAEGRVWTGKQAKDLGLVDVLGGLDTAVAEARTLAGLDAAQEVPVVRFPPRKSTLELFISLATEGSLFRPSIEIGADTLQSLFHAEAALRADLPVLVE